MTRKLPRSRKPGYEVGYGRPPKATRFQLGRSGNPKGRTKQTQNGKTLLQQALNEMVLVSEGGIPRRMSKREAFFKTLVTRGLKEPRFAALLMKIMEQYDLVKEEQIPRCVRIVFVDPDGGERDIDDLRSEKT